MFLFNLAQFSVLIDNTEQVIFEKRTRCLHLEHYRPKNRTRMNFAKNNFSVCQGTVAVLFKSKLKHS